MMSELLRKNRIVSRAAAGEELVWINPEYKPFDAQSGQLLLTEEDIGQASARLKRFAPLIEQLFPETADRHGLIESDLTEIPAMKDCMKKRDHADLGMDRLFLKRDSDLAVAGSVKARGGIYEVLKHSEDLALKHGLLTGYDDDYRRLGSAGAREFFGQYKIQVGSTGNLGMSIGIMGAALGYRAVVHMSADAREWKKRYLRNRGVTVIEYDGDYGKAVEQGRRESDADPMSYFVDDEHSKDLFLGYAVSAERLQVQLKEAGVPVDEQHPLAVYIPCGVGGAPGGISFGLKELYGDLVHIFFAEPVQACCMLLGLATGLHEKIRVQDIGLTGKTHADGLAVARPSGLAGRVVHSYLSGEVTVRDSRLYDDLRNLAESEGIFIEPSSCAAFQGPRAYARAEEMKEYIGNHGLEGKQVTHIVWATGGSLVPEQIRQEFLNTYPE